MAQLNWRSGLLALWLALAGFLVLCLADDFTPDIKVLLISTPAYAMFAVGATSTLMVAQHSVWISKDQGKSWSMIPGLEHANVMLAQPDPNFEDRAFVLLTTDQYVTNDGGKSWSKFSLPVSKHLSLDKLSGVSIHFNAADRNLLMFSVRFCSDFGTRCTLETSYTTDGLRSGPKPLGIAASTCTFATANRDSSEKIDPLTVLCLVHEYNSFNHVVKSNLLALTDFFKNHDIVDHVFLKNSEIIDVRVESAFIVVVMKTDKFAESLVSLLVLKDAANFEDTDLQLEMAYGAIFFLKSLPLALRLSVYYQGHRVREELLYASDSSGTKFVQRARVGLLSTIDSQSSQGVWFSDIRADEKTFDFQTMISQDDLETWKLLEVLNDDSCKLSNGCSFHFLPESRATIDTEILQLTPNVLIAGGAQGSKFTMEASLGTYVSRDGGLSWTRVLDGLYQFGYTNRGNVIVAIQVTASGELQDTLHFSLDQGILWQSTKLEVALIPVSFAANPALTSTSIAALGFHEKESVVYAFDFANAFGGKKCGDSDFETIDARVGNPCVNGHKETFTRRKPDAQCLVDPLAGPVKAKQDACDCAEADFECSELFKLEDGRCVPDAVRVNLYCKTAKKAKFEVPDKKLKDGNKCKVQPKTDFATKVSLDCSSYGDDDVKGSAINIKLHEVDGLIDQYSYIQSGSNSSNIIVHTTQRKVIASNDGGLTFVSMPVDEEILFFVAGLAPETVLMVSEEHVFYSVDGGNTFTTHDSPGSPWLTSIPVVFDPNDAMKFIFFSAESQSYDAQPFYTENGGKTFEKLPIRANSCGYVSSTFGKSDNTIYCSVPSDNAVKLLSSKDYFKNTEVVFKNIVGFAVKPEFVLVATIGDDGTTLKLKVTGDGVTFADSDFPHDFKVEAQTAYTVLDSSSHSIFIHVTTDREPGHERGAILKSNSNGTSYVLSLDDVNRNYQGYVDYDKVDSMEGILLANTVYRPQDSGSKRLRTQISHNDGSEWSYLMPPPVDSEGKKYACSGQPLAKCSLNLHGFTERPDYRDTFSSSSAVGYLIGVGSVGDALLPYKDSSTFISTDGGVSWREVAKGVYMWEYGDRGTILVLVENAKPTDTFLYSTDDGVTWQSYKFAKEPVMVKDLATVPTDTARTFLIFAEGENSQTKTLIYSLDFTRFYKRQCQIDLDNPLTDDFEYWAPRHPESDDDCLFGHETKYLRRARGHNDCFIGAAPLSQGMKIVKNCTCTRRDFECDYNYFRDTDGTCKLVKGLTPQDRKKEMCEKPGVFEYFEPTGYRKIPLSTCVGGKAFDSWDRRPCPGHEKEFNEKYGVHVGFGGLLTILFVPLAIFLGATWFVYEKGIKRNGGFRRLGQIRLGDDDFQPVEENNVDVVVNKIVHGGIVAAAGVLAVGKFVMRTDLKIFETLARVVFGRRVGRNNYVRVPDDEDELFGDFRDNYDDELRESADVNFEVDNDPEEFENFTEYNDNEEINPDAGADLFGIDDEELRSHEETPGA